MTTLQQQIFEELFKSIVNISKEIIHIICRYIPENDKYYYLRWYINSSPVILNIICDYAKIERCCREGCFLSIHSRNWAKQRNRRLRNLYRINYRRDYKYCMKCSDELFNIRCISCNTVSNIKETRVAYAILIDTKYSLRAGNTCPTCAYELLEYTNFLYCKKYNVWVPNNRHCIIIHNENYECHVGNDIRTCFLKLY